MRPFENPNMQQSPSSSSTLPTFRFWADWDADTYCPEVLRKDTRIYWEPQVDGTVGECVGTFFGENPGSARSIKGLDVSGRSPIVDRVRAPGDPTLQLIYDTWNEAYRLGVVHPKDSDYIEVLNLYYFRNADSGKALVAWNQCGGASIYSPAVSPTSEFVLLGWGQIPNRLPQALAAIQLIGAHTKVLIPDSKANLWRIGGPLTFPISPYPAMPSRILRSGLRKDYIDHVAPGF
jgi:hypothetical protein